MNTINLDEKLELAKELGLSYQQFFLEFRRDYLDLKFKPITKKEIKKRLGESWKTKIADCWVNDFRYPIPYGAMLAQKEAGEKGILHHRVWYPVTRNPIKEFFQGISRFMENIANDPIITGIDKYGQMVEIYAWNEDDVYGN